jgi:hypothetical protein
MLKNLLKVKSIITLSVTATVLILAIYTTVSGASIVNLIQNPITLCVINAFMASYTSLYMRDKNKADDTIAEIVTDTQKNINTNWSQKDIDEVMKMNRQVPVAQRQAEPLVPTTKSTKKGGE